MKKELIINIINTLDKYAREINPRELGLPLELRSIDYMSYIVNDIIHDHIFKDLNDYISHKPYCIVFSSFPEKERLCSCGLKQILNQ